MCQGGHKGVTERHAQRRMLAAVHLRICAPLTLSGAGSGSMYRFKPNTYKDIVLLLAGRPVIATASSPVVSIQFDLWCACCNSARLNRDGPAVPAAARGSVHRVHTERTTLADVANLREARKFIAEYLRSAEQLEVLLLLHSNPERDFSAAEVSQRVYTVPAAALLRLDELAAHALLTTDRASDPRYRYAPTSPELARRVDVLAEAYRANRVAVVRLIYETPVNPVRSLADAFRVRQPGE